MSSEGPVGHYARAARRAAELAARRAASPLVAVRQQKEDLEQAQDDLLRVSAELAEARRQVQRLQLDLAAAERNADHRRATDAVERLIEREVDAAEVDAAEVDAAALRDLALAVADLDANRASGVIVVDEATAPGRVIAGARSGERALVAAFGAATSDRAAPDLVEPVALAHLTEASYADTLSSLQRVAPLLVSGGRIVVDAYARSADVQRAVDEYFRDRPMDFRYEQHQRRHVVRR